MVPVRVDSAGYTRRRRHQQSTPVLFAQDTTTRVWDIRQPGKSLVVLSGRMGAVRSLRFSSDGRFLAMAEPADFVHLFDVEGGFKRYTRLGGSLQFLAT